jgi:nucleoside phosphorylase
LSIAYATQSSIVSSYSTMDYLRRLTHSDYIVAYICPMGVELVPVEAILDEIHQNLHTSRDKNVYTLGRISEHNIVIAVLLEIGNNTTATVVTQLLNDFTSVRFGLLVGIGGGIPGEDDDIRLGDVVISKPTKDFGGVVQFDMGKIYTNKRFERTGSLKKPPAVLMANISKLEAQYRRIGNRILEYLSQMLERFPTIEDEYIHPGMKYNRLFETGYNHNAGGTCGSCDPSKIIEYPLYKNTSPRIYYSTISSSNTVIKDSKTRDKLRKDLSILYVEMEAAGLIDDFSYLVIRGICDYTDLHKNKIWQLYAAATAAAYTKELLSIIPANEVMITSIAEALRGTLSSSIYF